MQTILATPRVNWYSPEFDESINNWKCKRLQVKFKRNGDRRVQQNCGKMAPRRAVGGVTIHTSTNPHKWPCNRLICRWWTRALLWQRTHDAVTICSFPRTKKSCRSVGVSELLTYVVSRSAESGLLHAFDVLSQAIGYWQGTLFCGQRWLTPRLVPLTTF